MAGHSQFKNIMHRKEAQDGKKAKRFGKLLREITVAARLGGVEPASNPRLRTALTNARQANMPKDNIDRALKSAGEKKGNYEEMLYEGFGAGNAAVLVEVLTNNRNRSICDIRTIFNKHSGHLTDVKYLFSDTGIIFYTQSSIYKNEIIETAIEGGALDIQETEEKFAVLCSREQFFTLKEELEQKFGSPDEAIITWLANIPYCIDDDVQKQTFGKMIAALEEYEDVQNVWTNTPIVDD